MGYIGQDPRFKPISLFEFNDDNDLTPTDRFFPIEDPHFELLDNGQDITFKASNYFKSAGEVGDLSLDPVTGEHEAEDLIVF